MGVREIDRFLEQWQMDARDLHRRIILSPTPRERERWHAIGRWAAAFGEGGPAALIFEQSGGSPPALGETQQVELKKAVQEMPTEAGIGLGNWRVINRFVWQRFGVSMSRSSSLNYPHQLGVAFKRPKKRLVKMDKAKREAFVSEYATLRDEGGAPAQRYSLLMRPTSERTRTCRASGR